MRLRARGYQDSPAELVTRLRAEFMRAEGDYPITIQVGVISSPVTVNSASPGPVILPIQHRSLLTGYWYKALIQLFRLPTCAPLRIESGRLSG
jgi:hypothetical protein